MFSGGFGGLGSTTQAQAPPQQQQASGGLFGGLGSTQPNATGTTSLFGNTQNAQNNATSTPGGGLFGNTGNLFGTSAPGQQQQQQQQQQQPAANLFSTQTPQQGTGVGLFGNTAQQNTNGGLFGGNAQPVGGAGGAGGLFGNTAPAGATTGGGLFGGSQTQNTTGTGQPGNSAVGTSSGGFFGNTGNQPTGGGLFGNSTTGPAPSGGFFGNSTTTNLTGGGLFGTQPAQQSQPSLFGQQKPALSLFNQFTFPQTQQQTAGSSSLFGQPVQQQPTSLLGSLGASALGTSALGNSLFSSRATIVPHQYQTDPHSHIASLIQRIEGVKQAWDPASPQCRFQVRC
jgi:nuclear pore complex protein Nup54